MSKINKIVSKKRVSKSENKKELNKTNDFTNNINVEKLFKFMVASDHAGRKLKLKVVKILENLGIPYYDCSPKNQKTDDYPDFAKMVGDEVVSSPQRFGLLICGSGIGMSIASNKVRGVRAALVIDKKDAELARKHNDANVLVLKGWKNYSDSELKSIINIFYKTKFEGGRHKRRIDKIRLMEYF